MAPASPTLATLRPGLLAGQRQIGFDLNRIGELEDQQLGDLHAMVGERGGEMYSDPEVVGGEAEALLRFQLLRCERHIRDARIRREIDGPVVDSQGPADRGRHPELPLER